MGIGGAIATGLLSRMKEHRDADAENEAYLWKQQKLGDIDFANYKKKKEFDQVSVESVEAKEKKRLYTEAKGFGWADAYANMYAAKTITQKEYDASISRGDVIENGKLIHRDIVARRTMDTGFKDLGKSREGFEDSPAAATIKAWRVGNVNGTATDFQKEFFITYTSDNKWIAKSKERTEADIKLAVARANASGSIMEIAKARMDREKYVNKVAIEHLIQALPEIDDVTAIMNQKTGKITLQTANKNVRKWAESIEAAAVKRYNAEMSQNPNSATPLPAIFADLLDTMPFDKFQGIAEEVESGEAAIAADMAAILQSSQLPPGIGPRILAHYKILNIVSPSAADKFKNSMRVQRILQMIEKEKEQSGE